LIRGTWAFDSKPSIQYASYSHQWSPLPGYNNSYILSYLNHTW
jgi:hypothetical protein